MQLITVEGHTPDIADDAWVAPGAVVAGRVTIGAGSGVWYTAVVRADLESVTVGQGSNLQDGVVVHADPGFPAVIGDDVTVGHRAVVHGCSVEDECLVGMGAVLLNGATIGRGSVVAAGAVVSQGVAIPPGSLVAGVPGKVRRETTEDELTMIRASAQAYRHLRGLFDLRSRESLPVPGHGQALTPSAPLTLLAMRHEVTAEDTAVALGSGEVEALGTPRLIAWLEAATIEAARPLLGAGETTVGTGVRIRHRRPTPVGGRVEATAELRERDGARMTFTVRAEDGDGRLIGDGEIDRTVVDSDFVG